MKLLKKIRIWYRKEFCVLTVKECVQFNLHFCHNIYGDAINNMKCRSIWRDDKGKSYRCESIVYENSQL